MTTQLRIPVNPLLVKETEPFTALSFTTQATLRTLGDYNYVPERLYAEADRLGLTPNGPIQYVYTGVNGDETNPFQLAIALPIRQSGEQPNGLSYQEFPAFRCASYVHTGSWDDFPQLYDALFAQLRRDAYQNDGRVREVYAVVDFDNPANCVTEIQVGIGSAIAVSR